MHLRRLGRRAQSNGQADAQDWDASAPVPSGPLVFRTELLTAGELAGLTVHDVERRDPEAGTAA